MRARVAAVLVGTALLASSGTAQAITFGRLDGNRHPNVGGLVIKFQGERYLSCTGTLIAPDVFLTAAHCLDFPPGMGIGRDDVWVTFDSTFDQDSELIGGTYTSHPKYSQRQSDSHDIAVIKLDEEVDAPRARLPTAGRLTQVRNDGTLQGKWFTAVGYGDVRQIKEGGPHGLQGNSKRRYVTQSVLTLTKSWLKLDSNPSKGNGGSCDGDSGGPHFLRDSNLIVSITISGDANCRATDVTYRLDTRAARNFLDDFVSLP